MRNEGLAEMPKSYFCLTSTASIIVGKDCPVYEDATWWKARRVKALDADLVSWLINHLFFCRYGLKIRLGELYLPEADLVVFDRAHQILDIASEYLARPVFQVVNYMIFCRDYRRLSCYSKPY